MPVVPDDIGFYTITQRKFLYYSVGSCTTDLQETITNVSLITTDRMTIIWTMGRGE